MWSDCSIVCSCIWQFILFFWLFFFFKQKTAYEMRISDWSSDVCSSDLEDGGLDLRPAMLGRLNQHLQLLRVERDRSTIFKQIPVELPARHPERGREVARIHRRPQGGELVLKVLRRRQIGRAHV